MRTKLDKEAGIVQSVDSTDMLQPPIEKNTPLVIDFVESDDDEPRYPKRFNRGRGWYKYIYL